MDRFKPSDRGRESYPTGLTLDQAIGRLTCENIELRTAAEDVAQAQGDLRTAGLRNNPQLVPGVVQVPYGSFNTNRQGGPTIYNVQVSVPFDVSGKRRTRVNSSGISVAIAVASYHDAVRKQIDNLYKAFTDAVAAQETTLSIQAMEVDQQKNAGNPEPWMIFLDPVTLRMARRNAEAVLELNLRSLANLLNIEYNPADPIRVQGTLSDDLVQLPGADELVEIALRSRPDLAALRLTQARALADLEAIKAARLDDVIVNFVPYTFGSGQPYDQKSGTSWGISANIPAPIFNRQQGNILKAESVIRQAGLKVVTAERSIALEVCASRRGYDDTKQSIEDARANIKSLPTRFDDEDHNLKLDGKPYKELTRLGEEMNRVMVQNYRDSLAKYHAAIVAHRKSMLRLNTVAGCLIVPVAPTPSAAPSAAAR